MDHGTDQAFTTTPEIFLYLFLDSCGIGSIEQPVYPLRRVAAMCEETAAPAGGDWVGSVAVKLMEVTLLPRDGGISQPGHTQPGPGSSQSFVGQIRGKLPKSHLPRAMQSDTENMVELC